MNVKLYKNTCSPETADKNVGLSQIGTTTFFNEIGEINILQPQLLMAYDGNVNLLGANYCYIDLFKRYYFIKDLTLTSARRLFAQLMVDPLMSWSAELKEVDVVCVRNEHIGLNQIIDSSYPINPGDKDIIKIPLRGESEVTNSQFILMVM